MCGYVSLIDCVNSEELWFEVLGSGDEIPQLADVRDVEYIPNIGSEVSTVVG